MINNHYVLQSTKGGYAMAEPAIKKAINVLQYLNRDVDTQELYEIREKSLKDETSMINGAKLEGKLEVAAKMIKKGFSIDDIIEITGLRREEIQKLYELNKDDH